MQSGGSDQRYSRWIDLSSEFRAPKHSSMQSESLDRRDSGWMDLDGLLLEHKQGVINDYDGIRKDHWLSLSASAQCMNLKCKRKFSIIGRHHHCRRCGKLFCSACSSNKRRLNILARPDPSGRLYKVCIECFDDPQSLGACRNLLDEFNGFRWHKHQHDSNMHGDRVDGKVDLKPKLKSRAQALQACLRLTDGFLLSYERSALTKAASNLKGLIQRPTWKRAPNYVYENLVPSCRQCSCAFKLLLPRHFCCVCGAAICSYCSLFDMIVYVDNSEDAKAKWAIIKVIGCPDKEPATCVYLRHCTPCKDVLSDIQCQVIRQTYEGLMSDDAWQNIENVHTKLHAIKVSIEEYLPKYQDSIDSLTEPSGKTSQSEKSSIQQLAKMQGDLSDYFTQLVLTVHGVKKLKPATRCQATIIKNITKCTFEFYHENKFVFTDHQRHLEAITPVDVLLNIQHIVDSDAINSCYLSVKQLILEILHLITRLKLQDSLLLVLTPLEEVVLEELKRVVVSSGQDWDDHQECVNQLLKLQLKDRKLIKLPQNISDPVHLDAKLLQRSTYLLTQIQLQLLSKTSDRKFTSAKSMLEEILASLSQGKPIS